VEKNGNMVWHVRTRIILERGMRWIRRRKLIPHIDKMFALVGKMRDIEGKVASVMVIDRQHHPFPKKNLQGFPPVF